MTKFSDLALDPKVLQAVSESGYETPTPIQTQAIPHALEGRDVLGIAQTGTGKTASFVLPMITHLSKGRARARMPRSLVLAPTRELAAQVAENFEKYSKHVKLSMALLIGGVSFKDQDKLIDRGVDVLIATPGRLLDHFERGKLMLTGVQIMVVDEADRMLDMGFIPDIERIFKLVPFTRQTLFFSATMAPEITRITQEFLHNPVRVEVARQATTSETITQFVVKHTPKRRDATDGDKREVLRRLIRAEGDTLTNGIIFCNRKRDVDVVAKSLKKHGFDAAPLHGDLDQSLRMKILGDFRDGALKLLVASDVAARGLDIPTVSHVFNFDVPIHSEDYVHRIGRTGRAGRTGKAITLCFPHEEKYLAKIEELVKKTIPLLPSPLAGGEAAAEPEETAAPAPRRERSRRFDTRAEGRSEPRNESRGESRPDSRGRDEAPVEAARTRGGVSEQRGNRRDRGGNDRSVVGMGDHFPAFLLREFRFDPMPSDDEAVPDLDAAPETAAPEARVARVTEVAPVIEAVPAVEAAPELAVTPAVEAVPEAEAKPQVETLPEGEAKPAKAPRKRPTRARRTAHAAEVAQDAPATEATATPDPAEPAVSEAGTTASVAAEDAGDVVAEAAPAKPAKPRAPRKRAPRAKAAATETPAEAPAAETPAEEAAPAA